MEIKVVDEFLCCYFEAEYIMRMQWTPRGLGLGVAKTVLSQMKRLSQELEAVWRGCVQKRILR